MYRRTLVATEYDILTWLKEAQGAHITFDSYSRRAHIIRHRWDARYAVRYPTFQKLLRQGVIHHTKGQGRYQDYELNPVWGG